MVLILWVFMLQAERERWPINKTNKYLKFKNHSSTLIERLPSNEIFSLVFFKKEKLQSWTELLQSYIEECIPAENSPRRGNRNIKQILVCGLR